MKIKFALYINDRYVRDVEEVELFCRFREIDKYALVSGIHGFFNYTMTGYWVEDGVQKFDTIKLKRRIRR